MKLEILSAKKALKYVPLEKSGAIRIFNSSYRMRPPSLKENNNWIYVDEYFFDDIFPRSWKEFHGEDELLNVRGWNHRNRILFSEKDAKKILKNYENMENEIENLIIHCVHGANRSPAIGIAMNDIYDWGIKGLKEKFPEYRKYVYNIMMKEASKRR